MPVQCGTAPVTRARWCGPFTANEQAFDVVIETARASAASRGPPAVRITATVVGFTRLRPREYHRTILKHHVEKSASPSNVGLVLLLARNVTTSLSLSTIASTTVASDVQIC